MDNAIAGVGVVRTNFNDIINLLGEQPYVRKGRNHLSLSSAVTLWD